MKPRLTTIGQDAGLWFVYRGDRFLGAIWDKGAKVEGRRPDGYLALETWEQFTPGRTIAPARTFSEAIKIINQRKQ